MLSPYKELRFWTGIMRDHGEFILTSLSYNERDPISMARYYRDAFAALHERVKAAGEGLSGPVLDSLANDCYSLLCSFINFKRTLLARMLKCSLDSSLPPTFYNHMINEALDFCMTLARIKCNAVVNPTVENLSLNKLWLTDAAGHAASIADGLDPVEKLLIKEAREFEKGFNHLAMKTEELCSMLMRACLSDGALKYLNEEAYKKITEFICYLEKIKMLRMGCMALGTIKPLIPDHMIREEMHYLDHLASFMHIFDKGGNAA